MSDTGIFLFELVEGAFERLTVDQDQQTFLEETAFHGNASICMITGTEPYPLTMIQLGKTYIQVTDVIAADAFGATNRFKRSANSGAVPIIKTGLCCPAAPSSAISEYTHSVDELGLFLGFAGRAGQDGSALT